MICFLDSERQDYRQLCCRGPDQHRNEDQATTYIVFATVVAIKRLTICNAKFGTLSLSQLRLMFLSVDKPLLQEGINAVNRV
jgi:hypothetical protein